MTDNNIDSIQTKVGRPLNLRSFVYKSESQQDQSVPHMRLHPPVELVMNENEELILDKYGRTVLGPTGEPDKKRMLQSPPMLVFDHSTKQNRKLDPRDGLFYYMSEKPALGVTSGDYSKKRNIRFLITVTIYSETFDELHSTLSGIYYNLEQFRARQIGNEDIAVVVVFDGCENLDESMMFMFEDEDKLKEIPPERSMKHRISLYKNKHSLYPQNSVYMYQMNLRPESAEENKNPNFLTVFMAVKLKNAGKLSSHLWFLRGFCEIFNPFYVALIDCGTIPNKDAIYKIFQALEGDPQIGGVCGYMGLQQQTVVDKKGKRLDQDMYDQYDFLSKMALKFFCIQKAQKYEYSMSHILDKAFESLFGFIHVLPGAFSAYRWDALRTRQVPKKKDESAHRQQNHSILDDEYLISCLDPYFQMRPDYTIQKANMFLAEDRILCLEIFTKKNYIMKYIPDACSLTDPVKEFTLLMKQRRRWINGSWFALFYVLKMSPIKIQCSTHSRIRKISFSFSMLYASMNAMNAYNIIGIYFVFLWMTMKEVLGPYKIASISDKLSLDSLVIISYLIAVMSLFLFSLFYNQPERKVYAFQFVSSLLGIFMLIQFGFFLYIVIYVFFLQLPTDIQEQSVTMKAISSQMKIIIILTLIFFIVPSILNFKKAFFDILLPLKDYLYYSPQYFHTLLIFAFCNVNDLSWGTKGKDQQDEQQIKLARTFLDYKINFVGKWVLTNIIISSIGGIILDNMYVRNHMILIMGYYFLVNLGLRSVCASIEMVKYTCYDTVIWKAKINNKVPEYKRQSKQLKEYI